VSHERQIKSDKGDTERQHPKTQNRQEAKDAADHKEQPDDAPYNRRHVVATPAQGAESDACNTLFEVVWFGVAHAVMVRPELARRSVHHAHRGGPGVADPVQ